MLRLLIDFQSINNLNTFNVKNLYGGEGDFDALRHLSGLDELCYTSSEAREMSGSTSTSVWSARRSTIHWIGPANSLRGSFFGV